MTDSTLIWAIAILSGFGLIIALANRTVSYPALRGLLNAGLLVVVALFVVLLGFMPTGSTPVTALLAAAFGLAAGACLLGPVRIRLAGLFPARRQMADGGWEGFDPASAVHMTALVLILLMIGYVFMSYALAGGLSGLVAQYESPTGGLDSSLLSWQTMASQMTVFVLLAMMGVGFGARRGLPDTLRRLGLRAPTVGEVSIGMMVAFGLFVFVWFMGMVWQSLVPQQSFADQTELSQLLVTGVDTLALAFVLSLTAAVGEEIAFRGALQPVFGLLPTSIAFVLIHVQYTLTPAALILLVATLAFGWLRQRYNTTTAILAHFLYNYIPLVVLVYTQYILNHPDLLDSIYRQF